MSGEFVLPGFDPPPVEEVRQKSAKDLDDEKQCRWQKYRGVMVPCCRSTTHSCTRPATYTRTYEDEVILFCTRHKQEQWDWDYLAKLVK